VDEPSLPPDTLDGHCLAEEVIHALACGGLESRQRSKALAHLDECELCQALLADEVRGLPEFAQAEDSTRPSTLMQVGALVGGRYRIRRFVARGGMGEVYEAWDVMLSEQVAIKTINPIAASADQAKASARFKQEVQLSRRVADPHVCRIYEFGHHVVPGFGTLAYLTMEFIEGQTLGARLRKGPRLALDEVVELCRQILRGLAAAHAVGVLHRDLKSENVMLRATAGSATAGSATAGSATSGSASAPHAVIMDFGLARLLGDQAHLLTERYELVGSAAYMAPEQLEDGAALSEATDVFAFGVVLFEMLTGRLPFDGKSAVAIAMRRLTHKPPAPSSLVPGLSSAWDALVLRCLEREVDRRFASTEEVSAAIEAIAHVPVSPARRRRSVLLAAGALAASVCGIAYLSLRSAHVAVAVAPATQSLALSPALVPPAVAAVAPELASAPPAELVPALPPEPPAAKRPANTLHSPAAPATGARGPAAAPAPGAAQPPEDVRELFFLDSPGEPQPQNSK
jgi:eukaryotic-like serine/threonine-protein kinase